MKKLIVLLALFACLSIHAQTVVYHGAKHYSIKVEEFKKEGSLPKGAIVMLGDSHSEFGADWNRHFTSAPIIINRGIIGDDAPGIYRRLNQVLPYHPSKIFFECGTNDLSHGWSVERTFQGIVKILKAIRQQCPRTKLYVQSLFPLNPDVKVWKFLKGKEPLIRQLNKRLANYCAQNQLTFIDLYTPFVDSQTGKMQTELCRDGLHLTDKGYDKWAELIKGYMTKE